MVRVLPLVEAAWQLGVADPMFYQDMMALAYLLVSDGTSHGCHGGPVAVAWGAE